MRLPNGHRAIVDVRKLMEYCLNPDHPQGRHKARVFAASLGLTMHGAELLSARLREAAMNEEAVAGEVDRFGERYTIDFRMKTSTGEAVIRSAWIILRGTAEPRLTTCFVIGRLHE